MIQTRPLMPRHSSFAEIAAWLAPHLVDSDHAPRPARGGDIVLTGVTMNSRAVQPGDLFVAPAGARNHGATFAADALASGARAILTDPEGAAQVAGQVDVPVLVVAQPRKVVGELAALLYGHPAEALKLFAVTGTQGKTTTTLLAEGALQASGTIAAAVGTVGTRINGEAVKTALTTPEAPELQALFAVMREQGVRGCAMEVSSHALVMGRVDGVVFDIAAFTNLGRDHLDFHSNLEEYFDAKAHLFTPERARLGLVNIDDPYGVRLVKRATRAGIPVRTYAVEANADWRAMGAVATSTGSRFTLVGPTDSWPCEIRLPGLFNVSNAVCAVAGLVEAGFDAEAVTAALSEVAGVPGRLETIDEGQDFLAVVDYAHKPDAVVAVLQTLRERTEGRLIMVLGAGGDRDIGKRRVMGESAAGLADVFIVTDDNPRTEDPAMIRSEMLAGARNGTAEVHEVGDRAEAIRLAVSLAKTGDCVVVAGKGHETGQEIAGEIHPFDDRVELREALAR